MDYDLNCRHAHTNAKPQQRAHTSQDDCLHIIMEYASEGDLADLIAKRAEEKKGFTEDEIMFW